MLKHYTVNLSGAVQRLSSALGAGYTTPLLSQRDLLASNITFQPGGANANPTYVGGHAAVSSTDHAFSLPAGAAGVPPVPFHWGLEGRKVHLSDIYVIGTSGETLRFGVIE